jgi:hypothetical protein
MEIQTEYNSLELAPGDKVVAAVAHRDEIIIVTARGAVFRISPRRDDS